jgi:hypothetical protein
MTYGFCPSLSLAIQTKTEFLTKMAFSLAILQLFKLPTFEAGSLVFLRVIGSLTASTHGFWLSLSLATQERLPLGEGLGPGTGSGP